MKKRFLLWLLPLSLLLAGAGPGFWVSSGGGGNVGERVFDNGGQPWPFFNLIPAVAYNVGGQGVAYNVTPNAGCSLNASSYRSDYINFKADAGQSPAFRLGCSAQGEFHRYFINVGQAGPYFLNVTVADGASGGVIAVLIDNSQVATISVPNTGNWDTFTTVQSSQFSTTQANHTLTLSCLTGDGSGGCGDLRSMQGTQVPSGGLAGSFLPTAPLGKVWNIAKDEEFNSGSLDTSFWVSNPDGTGEFGGQLFINNSTTVTFNGGALNMTGFASPPAGSTGTCNPGGCVNGGLITHTFPTGGGYFEARLRGPTNINSAFWTYQASNVDCGGGYDVGFESDIFETGDIGGNSAQVNTHWDGYGSCHQSAGPGFIYSDATNFHVYGVWIDAAGGITYYRDGVQSYHLDGPLTTAVSTSRVVAFDVEGTLSSSSLQVDWFRYYVLQDAGGGVVPGPAQVAGFTNPVINQNFETSTFDQDVANWFYCPFGNGGVTYNPANPIWFQGYAGFGRGAPCSSTRVIQDPQFGNMALNMHWVNGTPIDGNVPNMFMMSIDPDWSTGRGRAFTNYWFEVVGRADNNELSSAMAWWALGNFGTPSALIPGSAVREPDYVERYDSGFGHNAHNFTNNCSNPTPSGDCTGGIGSQNITDLNYHRWAARQTGTLGGSNAICWYYEEIPDSSGLQLLGCNQPFNGTDSNQTNGRDAAVSFILSAGSSQDWTGCSPADINLSSGNYCSLQQNGGVLNVWIKRIRAYVCPAYTANQNPAGGAQQCWDPNNNPNP